MSRRRALPFPVASAEEKELANRLNFIYKGAKTKRFHTVDTLTSQNISEHSFGVAWLVHLLDSECSKTVILAALAHDLGEHIVSDVPSPAKRAFPALKAAVDDAERSVLQAAGLDFTSGFSLYEAKLLKTADMFDGMLWAIRERSMGSLAAVEVYKNFSSYYIGEGINPGDMGFDLFRIIMKQWENVNDGQ